MERGERGVEREERGGERGERGGERSGERGPQSRNGRGSRLGKGVRLRIIHTADLHLGYRQFPRTTKTGRNQREQDVTDTFLQAVQKIEELKPDLILVAGDIFHVVRPSNQTIMDALGGFERLTKVAPTIVISGNHEDKVSSETPCILPVLEKVGVEVTWDREETVVFDGRLCSIRCVPERVALASKMTLGDIILLHGEVAGALPFQTPHAIPRERFPTDRLYIALGHYHVRSDIWPNGGYSGSLDYVSTDIWQEARSGVPKGLIEYDAETKTRTFHPVITRTVVDLPPIDATDWSFGKTEAAIIAAAEFNGLPDGSIVRQRVTNLTKTEWRGQDQKAIEREGKRFLAFQVSPSWRQEERQYRTAKERKASLESDVETFLRARTLPADLSVDKLVKTGLQYLRESTPQIEVAE